MHSVFFSNNGICVVPSSEKPGFFYKFNKFKDNLYRCCRCRELGKSRYVTIVDGVVKARKNVDDDHHADCQPLPEGVDAAQQVDREMRADVRNSGKRPRDAFTSMMSSVAKKFKSSEEQAAVVAHLPAYGEVRRQLSRQRAVRCTPVPDPLDIPDALRVTLRGRQVDESDSNFNEPFLMYCGQEGRLQIFCARTELDVIHQSQYLICDGTFEMSPDCAYQVQLIA